MTTAVLVLVLVEPLPSHTLFLASAVRVLMPSWVKVFLVFVLVDWPCYFFFQLVIGWLDNTTGTGLYPAYQETRSMIWSCVDVTLCNPCDAIRCRRLMIERWSLESFYVGMYERTTDAWNRREIIFSKRGEILETRTHSDCTCSSSFWCMLCALAQIGWGSVLVLWRFCKGPNLLFPFFPLWWLGHFTCSKIFLE